jgi:hypothetical protein
MCSPIKWRRGSGMGKAGDCPVFFKKQIDFEPMSLR